MWVGRYHSKGVGSKIKMIWTGKKRDEGTSRGDIMELEIKTIEDRHCKRRCKYQGTHQQDFTKEKNSSS